MYTLHMRKEIYNLDNFSIFENIDKSYSKASKGKLITSFFIKVIKTYLRAEENFKCPNIDKSDVLNKDDKVITNIIHSSNIRVKLFKHYGAMYSQIQKHRNTVNLKHRLF